MSAPEGDGPHAAALAGLPGMTPRRLARLLDGFSPPMAWRALDAGAHPGDPDRRFLSASRRTDVDEVAERYERFGAQILLPGQPGYPTPLVGDPGAPAVLFAVGDPRVLEGRARVAVVGTRSATHYGRNVASEMAAELAGDGVSVVSGLASGIDSAAHAGATRTTGAGPTDLAPLGPPVAVVGTGLDVVYPAANRQLWERVAERGVVFSESPLGTQPRPGVFPARNRIIAALSDVVVVVECHHRGGAMYTAEAAARRSIPVCAVPGSVHSRASEGTNALLVDGCVPVRDAGDVLVALSLARADRDLVRIRARRTRTSRPAPPNSGTESRPTGAGPPGGVEPGRSAVRGPDVSGDDQGSGGGRQGQPGDALTRSQRLLLDAIDDTPTAFETILLRTDLSIAMAAEACDQLVAQGILRTGAGWWSTT